MSGDHDPRERDSARPSDLPRAEGYAFHSLLGVGGMGDVYLGVQLATDRDVAIKVIRDEMGASPDAAQRLLAEASAIARLKHRNVVELLDIARTLDASRPMIVLELVDGGDLTGWGETFPGWIEVRRAMRDVLRGLAAAHATQIVHADLKPSNLLRTRDGGVKISDFGIARWLDPLRRMPGPRAISGTPEYMAPEQLIPDGHVGPWTDLYAVGVMLYEWLGRDTPFIEAPDLPTLMRFKLTLDPPPLIPKPGLDIPPGVAELAQRLLSREPRERPRFAAEVRRELESLLHGATPAPVDLDVGPPAMSWFPSAHDASLALPTTPPLIGRRNEKRFIENQIASTQSSKHPRLVLLTGPAGIGKSRLALWAFGETERRGTMEGLAAGFDFDGIAHGDGLRHALGRLLGAPSSAGDPFGGPWRWLRGDGVEPFPAREVLDWIRSDRGYTSPARAAELAHQILRAASQVRPIYLWLDDLLWARDGAAHLVDVLLEADDTRILVVGTVRAGTADHASMRRRLDRWLGHPNTSLIRLSPLESHERAELAGAVLPLDPAFANQLGEELAESTPLEIVQSLTHWNEHGWLEGDRGEVRPAGRHTLSSLRLSTRDLFNDRLRNILHKTPDIVERTLITAALLGDPFEARVLRASLPDDPDLVHEAIEWALLRGLWRSAPGGLLRFDHGLLRTAAMDLLMHRADAARLQAQAARGIRQVHDISVPAIGLRVCDLWLAAGEFAEATATLLHTGQAIARAGAVARAHDVWVSLGEWIVQARDPRAHFDHKLLAAWTAYYGLRYQKAEEAIREALDIARRFDDPARIADARLLYANVAFHRQRYRESEAIAAELCDIDEPGDPARLRIAVMACQRLAELAALREDFEQVRAWHRRILELAPLTGDRALLHAAYAGAAEVALIFGDVVEADQLLTRSIGGFSLEGDTDDLPDTLEVRTRWKWARGDTTEALREAEDRLQDVRALGDAYRTSSALVTLSLAAASQDSASDLDRIIEMLLDAFVALPNEEPFCVWGVLKLADLLARRGRTDLSAQVSRIVTARRARLAGTHL